MHRKYEKEEFTQKYGFFYLFLKFILHGFKLWPCGCNLFTKYILQLLHLALDDLELNKIHENDREFERSSKITKTRSSCSTPLFGRS